MTHIRNHGPLIVSTDYFGGPLDARGVIFVSSNAGAFRILLPRSFEGAIEDMSTAKLVIVSRGHWETATGPEALEFLFEDESDSPYSIHVGADQCDKFPVAEDAKKEWLCTVWTGRRGKPHKSLERICRYRIVPVLPCLESWNEER